MSIVAGPSLVAARQPESWAELSFGPIVVRYDDSVIEPRPWTIAQSDWAAEAAHGVPAGPILEMCCGAGHIGLATAAVTGRPLVQVDASAAACELARHNARRAGLAPTVDVRHRRLLDAIASHERFPVILADPPYIRTCDVGRFGDPQHAIDGGEDGLEVAVACCAVAADHLVAGGVFSLQLGGREQWEHLAPRLPLLLRFVEHRSYGPDRSVVHLTRD